MKVQLFKPAAGLSTPLNTSSRAHTPLLEYYIQGRTEGTWPVDSFALQLWELVLQSSFYASFCSILARSAVRLLCPPHERHETAKELGNPGHGLQKVH